jgi:hypothetical protein
MLPTRSSRLALPGLALFAMACTGTGSQATLPTIGYPFSLYALSGAPANAPTAILFQGGVASANAGFGFDVAVDIDNAGTTRLYPVRALAGGLAGVQKRVGLQLVSGTTFEGLTVAPATGYDTVAAKIVVPGSVVAVETLEAGSTCLYSLNGSTLYSKLVVDSIKVPERRVYGRAVVDRNCGFHGLVQDSLPRK